MEKIESSIQNSPINASSDSVSVITMAPVATMASVSTLEKTAPELDSRHEISATTDMEATSIIEHKYLSENVGLLKEEPVKKKTIKSSLQTKFSKEFERRKILQSLFMCIKSRQMNI